MPARLGVCVAVMLAALLCAASRAAADMCITVDVQFERAPTRALVRSMHDEVESIWQPYGLQVEWNPAAPACPMVHGSFDVAVERRPSEAVVRQTTGRVLGNTWVRLTSIDHAPIHIDFDAIEQALQSVPVDRLVALAGHPGVESTEIGRALGRVLAHEIGHVVLAAPNHQLHGLMRPMFLSTDLVALQRDSFGLSRGEVARLRQRERVLGSLTVRSASGDPVVESGNGQTAMSHVQIELDGDCGDSTPFRRR